MTAAYQVDDVLDAWLDVRRVETRPDCCILATRTLGAVFERLNGWSWEALPCASLAANAAAVELLEARVPVEEWPEVAWSVGVDDDPADVNPGRYAGHLVLVLDTGAGLQLVDGALGQFSRPHRGLVVPEMVRFDIEDAWAPVHSVEFEAGTKVMWRPSKRLGKSHRVAPDWTRNWRDLADAVETRLDICRQM